MTGLTGRTLFIYRARVMAEFKKLTYEGLQVGEGGAATRVVVDVRCVNQDGETTAIGTASGVIR